MWKTRRKRMFVTTEFKSNCRCNFNSLMEEVERTQYQTVLAITGPWQGSNRSKLYEELGWEIPSDRCWCRLNNNMTPSYLRGNLSPLRGTLSKNNNPITFREIRCKTSRYKNSVFPDVISSWNIIITDFRSKPSLID